MDVSIEKNLVTIPIGLKIGLINKSKNCFKSIVRMINGFNKNQFLAIFDEEDVDFQLIINYVLVVSDLRYGSIIRTILIIYGPVYCRLWKRLRQ
jgi:hypothetical protein